MDIEENRKKVLELLRTTEEVPGYYTMLDNNNCLCMEGLIACELLKCARNANALIRMYGKVYAFVGGLSLWEINDTVEPDGETQRYKTFAEMVPAVEKLFAANPVEAGNG